MQVKKYIQRVFLIAFIIFFLNKFYLRPWVLENDLPSFLKVIVYSLPNLIEAIMGTTVVTGIAFRLREYAKKEISDSYIYLIAVFLAALYTISQELKFHNLGGNNVYDFNDVIASVVGLIFTYSLFNKYGFLKKTSS